MNTIHESTIPADALQPGRGRRTARNAYVWLRALATVAGLVGLAGASYFTFVAAPTEGGVDTPFEWFVGLWKIVIATTMLTATIDARDMSRP